MQQFSRSLFLLSRQCGAAGLVAEAQQLFQLAREAAGGRRAKAVDFMVYRTLAGLLGWKRVGRWSVWLDVHRKGVAG